MSLGFSVDDDQPESPDKSQEDAWDAIEQALNPDPVEEAARALALHLLKEHLRLTDSYFSNDLRSTSRRALGIARVAVAEVFKASAEHTAEHNPNSQ